MQTELLTMQLNKLQMHIYLKITYHLNPNFLLGILHILTVSIFFVVWIKYCWMKSTSYEQLVLISSNHLSESVKGKEFLTRYATSSISRRTLLDGVNLLTSVAMFCWHCEEILIYLSLYSQPQCRSWRKFEKRDAISISAKI